LVHANEDRIKKDWNDYLKIEMKRPREYKIKLFKTATVTLKLYVYKKNIQENKVKMELIMKEKKKIEEENIINLEIKKNIENKLKELDKEKFEYKNILSGKYSRDKIIEESQKDIENLNKKREELRKIIKELKEKEIKSKLNECDKTFTTVLRVAKKFPNIVDSELFNKFEKKYTQYKEDC
jgi:hypothetical protein